MSIWDKYKSISGYNMLNSFLHPEDAYKEAEQAENQGWSEAQNYQKPFWQAGVDQTGKLTGAENALLDPAALENQWASQYQLSPYAKQELEQNKEQGLDAASSMGLMGSSAALKNIQQGAGDITNADRQNFLNDLMQKYMTAIGIGQNIFNTGANVGTNLGSGAMQHGENEAGLKYGETAAPGALFGKMMGALGNIGANYATGGMSGAASGAAPAFSGAYTG